MSEQETAVQTDAGTGTATAEPTAPQAPEPVSSAPEPTQQPAQREERKGPLSRREARQGVSEDAKRLAERRQARQQAAPEPEPAEPVDPDDEAVLRSTTEALTAEPTDTETEATEEQEPQEQEGTVHPQYREGDPAGTYRDEEGRLRHAEGPLRGKFAAPDTGGDEGAQQGEETEATAAEERASDATPEAGAAEKQPIRIELPEGHPVREMGVAELTANDPQQEQVIKALVNGTYHRRAEVEELRDQLAEERRLRVQRESTEAAQEKWRQTPEYQQAVDTYQQILDMQGEEAAKQYWQGASLKLQELSKSEFSERWGEVEAQEQEAAARQWQNEAFQRAQSKLPAEVTRLPDFGNWFTEEVQLLNVKIEKGMIQNVNTAEDLHRELGQALARRLISEPAAVRILKERSAAKQDGERTAAQQVRETEQAAKQQKEKAVTEFQKKAAQKRVENPPNPLAGVQHRAAPEGASSVDTTPEGPDFSNMTPTQLKKHMREQSRQDAARRFGPRKG